MQKYYFKKVKKHSEIFSIRILHGSGDIEIIRNPPVKMIFYVFFFFYYYLFLLRRYVLQLFIFIHLKYLFILSINNYSFTALSHWIRGSGFPAYEVSNTTRAPRNTVVSQGPQSMVAGFGGCAIDSLAVDLVSSPIFKLLLNSMATSEFFSSVAVSVNVRQIGLF